MRTVKMHPSLLLLFFTLLTGVCPQRLTETFVKTGEMVGLYCSCPRGYHRDESKLIWTSHTTEVMVLTSMSLLEQRQMDVVIHGRNLVILKASVKHHGNYSCSLGNGSTEVWFTLKVYTAQSGEDDERTMYSTTCDTKESCTLTCPDVNTPARNILDITQSGITWQKEGELSPKSNYFSTVEENDQGVYTCTRTYLYQRKMYKMTFKVVLHVQPKAKLMKSSVIMSPTKDVYYVDLGSTVVIDCKALLYSNSDEVFWLRGDTFVDINDSLPVFYNYSIEPKSDVILMTASLVFKNVSEDDISKLYTCKLESSSEAPSFVTIALAQKDQGPGFAPLSTIHPALVDGQNDLVSIKTEAADSKSVSASEMVSPGKTRVRSRCPPAAGGRYAKTYLLLMKKVFVSVCPQGQEPIYVKHGEIVALHCSHYSHSQSGSKLIWKSDTTKKVNLSSLSSAEQTQMDVLVRGSSLIILRASANHQGNYSCSLGNASRKFYVNVTMTEAMKYEDPCHAGQSCTLDCPEVNLPNLTSNGTAWQRVNSTNEDEPSPKYGYFSRVEETDQGVYICTRSYQYQDQKYSMSFEVVLRVHPQNGKKSSEITSPQMNDIIQVDLGSPAVIDCKADIYSESGEVFWLIGETFVDTNNRLPVFYNYTIQSETEARRMTASLVFQSVSEEDLLKNYTCKLEIDNQPPSSVTITLVKKVPPPYISLALCITGILVVMIVTVVIYVKFKISISLFLRDTLGCHGNTTDGKSCDAFLMCYKSHTDAGLSDSETKCLMSALEDRFGYNLCLYDRDVLPGGAAAEAVLHCMEQSRTVILVPTSSDHNAGFGLLSIIHAALVDRQTHLVFIKTEAAGDSRSVSVPEALQLLAEVGDCVTWKGPSSMSPSSFFWKQLRYYLPAPQNTEKKKKVVPSDCRTCDQILQCQNQESVFCM
ncbi:X-linked interleukin-1 receptor accessory protein-like 2 [Antennarius striatus]|uniref:X-linked interleukin-1 receptor accessory protein-like 2 n=1 Tax=Antennarius striatus TaxID=241820 RepID=UPI0035AE51D6